MPSESETPSLYNNPQIFQFKKKLIFSVRHSTFGLSPSTLDNYPNSLNSIHMYTSSFMRLRKLNNFANFMLPSDNRKPGLDLCCLRVNIFDCLYPTVLKLSAIDFAWRDWSVAWISLVYVKTKQVCFVQRSNTSIGSPDILCDLNLNPWLSTSY
jgi:hypothetical protein